MNRRYSPRCSPLAPLRLAALCASVALAPAACGNGDERPSAGASNLTDASGSGASDGAGAPDVATGPDGAGAKDGAGATDGAGTTDGSGSSDASGATTTTVTLTETAEAFANPMMGFRPSVYIGGSFGTHEYASTYKHYIPYSDLESSASDTVQKIIDWSNKNWADLPAKNVKVIPRVLLVYPGTGEYWGDIPHDGTPDEWVTPELKSRLAAFVAKLGQAWNQDPRVAAVEMGLWGKWGEQNIWPDDVEGGNRIPADVQQVLASAFITAFPDKQVLVRYPDTFTGYTNFGFFWDSFALPDDDNAGGGQGIVARNLWSTRMQSGEVAYDWGNQSNLGGSPAGTLGSDPNTQYVIGYVQKLHTSSLGWIADYTPDGGVVSANAARLQKAMGYRFVIRQATFDDAVAASAPLDLSLTVENVASAPFYYGWSVGVGLLDATGKAVWRGALSGGDVRAWMPGASTTVHGSVTPSVPSGEYTLAVSVLDPAGNAPALRFANAQYAKGGWTVLGKVGVGVPRPAQSLPTFDSLYSDHSLSYAMGKSSGGAAPPAPGSGTPSQGNLARSRPVVVSSTESEGGGGNVAARAVDGDPATRWSSEWGVDPSFIEVDLGARHAVSRIKATWEWSYAAEYQVQVSDDRAQWTTAYTGSNSFSGDHGVTDVTFAPASGRYVRLVGTRRATTYGYSLYELEIYE